MQKIIKITIIFLLIFILGIFFLSLNKSSNYNTESLVGNKLGEIELVSFEDDSIFTNDDFKKNSFTLINFWASWCAPCRIEHPQLMELSKENNIKILGVNFKDKKDHKFFKTRMEPIRIVNRGISLIATIFKNIF